MALRTATLVRGFLSIVVIGLALLALPARNVWLSSAEKSAVPAILEPAIKGLNSPNAFERANAVKALHLSHDPAVAPILLEKLNDKDEAVGLYVAQALGDLAPANMLPQLEVALRDSNPDVRWRAALALGQLRDEHAIGSLTVLLRDSDLRVERSAADALARIGSPTAVNGLVAALDSEQASTTQAAMGALESMKADAVPALSKAMTAPHAQTRANAAEVLGYIASPQARPALQLATVDPDPQVRAAVEQALSQLPQ